VFRHRLDAELTSSAWRNFHGHRPLSWPCGFRTALHTTLRFTRKPRRRAPRRVFRFTVSDGQTCQNLAVWPSAGQETAVQLGWGVFWRRWETQALHRQASCMSFRLHERLRAACSGGAGADLMNVSGRRPVRICLAKGASRLKRRNEGRSFGPSICARLGRFYQRVSTGAVLGEQCFFVF
jgi:hypothetical protein